ncbi:MAG: hypothetical protein RBT74_13990 [Tenuifilaceae bacterium]|jgi:hypothetical protein|nr:hypothetical protein [Tenuifilaceae bacterium]
MKRIILPIIISTLLFAGCTKEESENILGLWDIEVITITQESLDNPPITQYTSNYDDLGKIFFKSNGLGALQIGDRYPGFDMHPIGASEFTWLFHDESFTFDNNECVITKNSWNSMEFERIVNHGTYNDRITYKLKR